MSGDGGDAIAILLDGRWFAHGNAICHDTSCSVITGRGLGIQGTGTWSTVPEPLAAWLLAAGLAGLAPRRFRSR